MPSRSSSGFIDAYGRRVSAASASQVPLRAFSRFGVDTTQRELMRSTSIALQVSASIQFCDFAALKRDDGTYQVGGAALHFVPARHLHCIGGGSKHLSK
jgi:hypothetical protein